MPTAVRCRVLVDIKKISLSSCLHLCVTMLNVSTASVARIVSSAVHLASMSHGDASKLADLADRSIDVSCEQGPRANNQTDNRANDH